MIARSAALFALTLIIALSNPLAAAEVKVGSLTVDAAWARPSIGKRGNSAAYMTITNEGGAPDRLIAVANPQVGKASLHTHIRDGDIMRMRHVEGGIPVPAHGTVALKPGGYHVMLMRLKAPIEKGGTLPLTLTFERADTVTVQATVTMKPAMKGHGSMKIPLKR